MLDLDNGTLDMEATSLTITGRTVDAIAQELANGAEVNAKFYTDTKVSKGVETAVTIAENHTEQAIDAQTQEDIFNKLTNNGALQGLFMQDGKLYINAEYLAAGAIASLDGSSVWDLVSGVMRLSGSFETTPTKSGQTGNFYKLGLNSESLDFFEQQGSSWVSKGSIGWALLGKPGETPRYEPGVQVGHMFTTDLFTTYIGTTDSGSKRASWKKKSELLDSDYVLVGN